MAWIFQPNNQGNCKIKFHYSLRLTSYCFCTTANDWLVHRLASDIYTMNDRNWPNEDFLRSQHVTSGYKDGKNGSITSAVDPKQTLRKLSFSALDNNYIHYL